jgi:hypothetical protein
MKQTAVEYLVNQFRDAIGDSIINVMTDEIEQAKEMEKEKDNKYTQMLEMLKRLIQPDLDISDLIEAENLIKEATEI